MSGNKQDVVDHERKARCVNPKRVTKHDCYAGVTRARREVFYSDYFKLKPELSNVASQPSRPMVIVTDHESGRNQVDRS